MSFVHSRHALCVSVQMDKGETRVHFVLLLFNKIWTNWCTITYSLWIAM